MVRRRAVAAEIETAVGNHSFRATGITAYLKNGGTLEKAAAMANDASTRTTQLYDLGAASHSNVSPRLRTLDAPFRGRNEGINDSALMFCSKFGESGWTSLNCDTRH